MKKIIFLLTFVFILSVTSFGIDKITSGDYAKMHPGLPANSGMAGVVKGTSNKLFSPGTTYTYVGHFNCFSGVYWVNNPPCYTGQEAAALLFGGNPEDYVTSTNPSETDPSTITFTCWCCGYATGPVIKPQDFKVDLPPAGYADPGGDDSAISAYVSDFPVSGDTYVWKVSKSVPVSKWAIVLGFSLIGLFVAVRFYRRRKLA
jgi:hypothetical protein